MPIHLHDVDVAERVAGRSTALIVPCYMCPAVTVAVNRNRPFLQLFRSFLKSPPFEEYIGELQSRLRQQGVATEVFKSRIVHQWFLCMWTFGRRRKLKRQLEKYDAAIVLGCDSATETVRGLIGSNDCRVIQGMEISGFMNAKMRFDWPGNISFADCKIIPLSPPEKAADAAR